jgi:GrpB-like predicted nucleotidyltransferase (UPF0157 family)
LRKRRQMLFVRGQQIIDQAPYYGRIAHAAVGQQPSTNSARLPAGAALTVGSTAAILRISSAARVVRVRLLAILHSFAMRNILIVPYDPLWPAQFHQETATLRTVFGQALISIHHIGSTSIPGMSAKPIIDIMLIVRDIETVEGFSPAMMQLGYESKGENGIPGRRYFVKGGDEHRTHHVHTYALDNPEVQRHLDLRDYLIAHSEEARQYAELKAALAQQFPHDIDSYVAGKDGFIKEMLRKAQQWRAGQVA